MSVLLTILMFHRPESRNAGNPVKGNVNVGVKGIA